jgi:hypothetical protein
LLPAEAGDDRCIQVIRRSRLTSETHAAAVQIGGPSGPTFSFDYVMDSHTPQRIVYESSVQPLVDSCLQGYNATILAYGQTGAGKTHTIMGPWLSQVQAKHATAVADDDSDSSATDGALVDAHVKDFSSDAGVIPRAVRQIFRALQKKKRESRRNADSISKGVDADDNEEMKETLTCPFEFTVKVQFLELYGEEIRDLLANDRGAIALEPKERLTIRDGGTNDPEVVGATQIVVPSAQEALECLTKGNLHRVTAATAMNDTSSRSHAILTIFVEQSTVDDSLTTNGEATTRLLQSKFNFVDLAGSERVKRTQAEGRRLKEGIDINKGLLVLGNVISALGDPTKRGRTFVPYRDSKLTRLLQGSLGGNHKTLMMACVSPASSNLDESLNCLRYANRAKNIQNRAVVNVDATTKLVSELQTKVRLLAVDLLQLYDFSPSNTSGIYDSIKFNFDRESLIAMAAGSAGYGSNMLASSAFPEKSWAPSVTSTPRNTRDNDPTPFNEDGTKRQVEAIERELAKVRSQLRETRENHERAETELYVSKAQTKLFELQVSVLSQNDRDNDRIKMSLEQALVAQVAEYEKEIGKLRGELQRTEKQLKRVMSIQSDDLSDLIIEKAKQGVGQDREILRTIQRLHADNPDTDEPAREFDLSESNEHDELTAITNKYLMQGGSDDILGESSSKMDSRDQEIDEIDGGNTSSNKRRRHALQTDLMELSKSIAVKEELIDQLKLSQEKYAVSQSSLCWKPSTYHL